ncbi:MAG: acetylglutamate kinase [Cyclobacteriaceae bacterium]
MQKLFIVKIGGNVIDEPAALKQFLVDFSKIQYPKILVHGGGTIATKIGKRLGIESKYVNGRRITDEPTRDLVTMVYGGLLNKQIVTQLQTLHTNAIGLTGADGNMIKAKKRPVKEIDYGYVGDIETKDINTSFLYFLLKQNLIPIVAPLTHAEGIMLNTNADTIASAMAIALSKHFRIRLIYCFEKKGVLMKIEDDQSVIPKMDKTQYLELRKNKKVVDGMIPKLDNAFDALQGGVHEILVGSAEDILSNVGEMAAGTLITA